MQFDSIAESSHRSFLQYYQAALGNHLFKALRYVIFSVYICINVHVYVFQDKLPENLHGSYYILKR